MCSPASLVVARNGRTFFSLVSESHSDIESEHGLPPDGYFTPSRWNLEVKPVWDKEPAEWTIEKADSDPDWVGPLHVEAARAALAEWYKMKVVHITEPEPTTPLTRGQYFVLNRTKYDKVTVRGILAEIWPVWPSTYVFGGRVNVVMDITTAHPGHYVLELPFGAQVRVFDVMGDTEAKSKTSVTICGAPHIVMVDGAKARLSTFAGTTWLRAFNEAVVQVDCANTLVVTRDSGCDIRTMQCDRILEVD